MILPGLTGAMMLAGAAGAPSTPFSSVVLLCGFEGSHGSTTFVDESSYARTLTFNNSPSITTAQFKYGASCLANPINAYVIAADSDDFAFGTGEFTLEAFVRHTNQTSGSSEEGPIVAQWRDNGNRAWSLQRFDEAPAKFGIKLSSDGAADTEIKAAYTFTDGVWYHVAADRDAGGTVRVYVDGVMIASGSFTASIYNPAFEVRIGANTRAGVVRTINGFLDEVRITKGYARYASDGGFTPPTAAFPRS
jgi:hypothetical protein